MLARMMHAHYGRQVILLIDEYDVKVRVSEESTYNFETATESDFWGILYLTGYLTPDREQNKEELEPGELYLKIPNNEVRTIFGDTSYGAAFHDKDCLIRTVELDGMGAGSMYGIE